LRRAPRYSLTSADIFPLDPSPEIAAEIARVQGLAPDELRRTWRITAAAEGASSVNLIELKPAEPHHAVGRGHAHLS
jgi:hypothetical protein